MILAIVLAPLARASEEAADSLKWQPRGVSAAPTASRAARSSDSAPPAIPRAERAVLQWTPNRMSYQPPRAKRRESILRVNGYAEAETRAVDAPMPIDPDAGKNPFLVASQPAAGKDPPETPGELPIPDKTTLVAEPAGELPVPDTTTAPVAEPASELPIPDKTTPAAEPASELPVPDTTNPAGEPAPLTPSDDLFKDEPIPTPPDTQLPTPSGDLAQEGTLPAGPGCKGYAQQCRDQLRELQERDITKIFVGVVIEGTEGVNYPCDCLLGRDFETPRYAGRNFSPTLFTWKASGSCHKPLYFEDVQLERYGHSWNPVIQPFISGAHFFVSVPLLPYKMGLMPPHECVYTLGYYRPGNCAPYMFEPIPLSLRAAVWEGFGAAAFAFWFWPPN